MSRGRQPSQVTPTPPGGGIFLGGGDGVLGGGGDGGKGRPPYTIGDVQVAIFNWKNPPPPPPPPPTKGFKQGSGDESKSGNYAESKKKKKFAKWLQGVQLWGGYKGWQTPPQISQYGESWATGDAGSGSAGDPGGGDDSPPHLISVASPSGMSATQRMLSTMGLGPTIGMGTGILANPGPMSGAGESGKTLDHNGFAFPTGSPNNGIGWMQMPISVPTIIVPVGVGTLFSATQIVPENNVLYHPNHIPSADADATTGYGPRQLGMLLKPGTWWMKYKGTGILRALAIDASNPAIIGRYLLEGGFVVQASDVSAVAVTAVSSQVVDPNMARRYLQIQNVGLNDVVVRPAPTGTAAVFPNPVDVTIRGTILAPNGAGIVIWSGDQNMCQAVQAVCKPAQTSFLSILSGLG